ncbi:hypothetical protein RCL_jg18737.t1 [Rhizophagus clarus]|uniref:Uncharacterized protein n=1 Tax=Rhizophagus clarus TaxID=94130 RepID=A0A8H3R5S4_9GLOM|nr:hypothetical protein RCL_jg18737.t1 [Rhizophagus clarus]
MKNFIILCHILKVELKLACGLEQTSSRTAILIGLKPLFFYKQQIDDQIEKTENYKNPENFADQIHSIRFKDDDIMCL